MEGCGSHAHDVESTRAQDSRRMTAVGERTLWIERLVAVPRLLARGHEPHPSTREHQPTREQTPGCKRSPANGDVRLAILPYGRWFRLDSRQVREVALRQIPPVAGSHISV